MPRIHLAALCLLLPLGCQRDTPTTPPEDVPVTTEDPIEGDPTDIEGEEIGEDVVDDAQLVEPGPAEAAVQEPTTFEDPP